eukprot:TRINITY_DN1338_c0_g1_i1.p1 TRINITY_DN1338_c0_g1~~TRINITY_DN1338_c0_g1_i1.p1  ORF type:complete len:2578 (+),score=254.02 TRINITY_DN1338_c0_g1_i1:498-8231(+)
MTSKRKTTGRPRPNTALNDQPKLPHPPAHVIALKKSHPSRFVIELVSFFRKQKHHPEVCVGWWCGFPKYMAHLITYLSEPSDDDRQTWEHFRRQVAIQIKNCRQCAVTYHQSVAAWEISEELRNWPKSVARKRVQSLLDWDCDRILPSIIKGAHVDEEDPSHRGAMMQCREAFLESLTSLRLCTHSKFCEELGGVFRKRTPARNAEDVIPFIRNLGYVPSGLLALCFHEVQAVQVWALRVYRDCRGLQAALQPLLFLLRKELLRINQIQLELDFDTYLDGKDYDNDVSKLQSRWEGFAALLCKADKDTLSAFLEGYKKIGLMKSVAFAVASKFEKIAKSGFRIIRALLRSIPYDLLFQEESVQPKELLDNILLGVRRPSNSSSTRESLLSLLSPIFNLVRANFERERAVRLYTRCLQKLYAIADIPKLCGHGSETDALEALPGIAENPRDRRALLKVVSKFLLYFYRYTVPALPVEDAVMITNIVLSGLWEDPAGDWSWDLLRFVLLTDVLNILRNLLPAKDMENLSTTFLEKRVTLEELRPEEETYFSDLMNISEKGSQRRTWVGPLWRKVLSGDHIRDHNSVSDSAIEREMSVLLDLHRVVGIIDDSMVQAGLDSGKFASHTCGQTSPSMIEKHKRSLVGCISTVQEIVWSRFQRICDTRPTQAWMRLLPFHAAHLLSSAKKNIHVQCMTAMRRSFGLQNNSTLGSQSKLLAVAVKQNTEAAAMLVDGVDSSLRIMCALGDMVSLRTYASFFLWFHILHKSGYSSLLCGKSISYLAVGVVHRFSESWKSYENHVSDNEFREALCQFFTNLRGVWSTLCADANNKKQVQAESSIVRKATKGLFSMHAVKNPFVLAPWVLTVASMAPEWKASEEHRAAMCDIIESHVNGVSVPNRMTLEQCQMLVHKGCLDAARSGLKRYKKGVAKDLERNANTNAFKSTKIDQYFAKRSTSEPGRHGNFQTQGMKNSSTTHMSLRSMRPRLPLVRTIARPVRGNGHLSELRKGLLGDAPVRTKARRELQPESRPTKTPFELQIEHARAKKAARLAAESNRVLQPIDVFDKDLSPISSSKGVPGEFDAATEPTATTVPDPEESRRRECTLPTDIRTLHPRDMDLLHRALIQQAEPPVPVLKDDLKTYGRTFASTKAYVEFWEPLITSEYRVSIQNMVREENYFATKFHCDPQGYRYCRTAFEVQEPPSSIGHFHQLRLKFCADQGGLPREFDQEVSSSEFSVFQSQPTDLVYLRIPPARCTERDGGPISEAIALVSTSKVEKGVHELVLQLCFDDGLDNAPGKGRRIQISRLMSLVTFQRQIEALWSISGLPDGLLWPLLDPSHGLSVNEKVNLYNREISSSLAAGPLDFVSDLETSGSLNNSQANAISNVIRSSGPLFQYHGSVLGDRFFKKNHGALSLIQGPPGTGKTSTIMNMVSALISTSQSRTFPRVVRVSVEETSMRIRIPAIRVLVCAPSNAAVDEIMLRVVEQGLTFPGGGKACPRIVRIGTGTTIKHLERFELRSLARCKGQRGQSESELSTKARLDNRCRALQVVNERISEAHNKRISLLRKEEEEKKSSDKCITPELVREIQSLTEQLTLLHEEKEVLKGHLSKVRDERKVHDQARRVEKMKRMSKILNQSALVFSTLNSAGHELMKTLGLSFDVIIIDEAAQSIEPESLIPMTLGVQGRSSSKFSQVVLVGDPQQLPATVVSTNPSVVKHFGTSLFERICVSDRQKVTMLDVQYRMHPSISSFPNQQFYQGKIQDGPNVVGKQAVRSFHGDSDRRFGPLTFYDTSKLNHSENRTTKGSLSNLAEARLVVTILKGLVQSYRFEDFRDAIAVLSPYRQQVLLLRQLVQECKTLDNMKIEVSTIDGIQGREKQVVVLSTVRGRNSKTIGFVDDARRMNVALTRAMHSLLIVGNATVLSCSSVPWHGLIQHCRENSYLFSMNTGRDGISAAGKNVVVEYTGEVSSATVRCLPQGSSHGKRRIATPFEEGPPRGKSTGPSTKKSSVKSTRNETSKKFAGKEEKPSLNSSKRPRTSESSDRKEFDAKKRKANPRGFTEERDRNISSSNQSRTNTLASSTSRAQPGHPEESSDDARTENRCTEEKSTEDQEKLAGSRSSQIPNGCALVSGCRPVQVPTTKGQTENSTANGNMAFRTVPLRSNMLVSIPAANAVRANIARAPAQQTDNINISTSSSPETPKSNSGPTRPFAPWKRKTKTDAKGGSPFEKDTAVRFVPPGMPKSQDSKGKTQNANRMGTTASVPWKMYNQSPRDTLINLGSQAVRPAQLNHLSQPHASAYVSQRSPMPELASRLGKKQHPTQGGSEEGARSNALCEASAGHSQIDGGCTHVKWSQNVVSNRQSPRTRRLTVMELDANRRGSNASKAFPGVSPEIRKGTQKSQTNPYVNGTGNRSSKSYQQRSTGNMVPLPITNVNHRGFVKKTSRDGQRVRGKGIAKRAKTAPNSASQSASAIRNRNPNSGNRNTNFSPRRGPFAQTRSRYSSRNGAHHDLMFPTNHSDIFGHRTAGDLPQLTAVANQSNSVQHRPRTPRNPNAQKPVVSNSLLQRLQVDQARTLDLVSRGRDR